MFLFLKAFSFFKGLLTSSQTLFLITGSKYIGYIFLLASPLTPTLSPYRGRGSRCGNLKIGSTLIVNFLLLPLIITFWRNPREKAHRGKTKTKFLDIFGAGC
jgi:hypothetical protein